MAGTALASLLLLGNLRVMAQDETPKLELGARFALLGLDGVKPALPGTTDLGFGGRITWNLNYRYSVESEVSFFPKDQLERGRRILGLFGLKMSARVDNAGVFLKIRPGFISFKQAGWTPTLVDISSFNTKNFALDLGGGLEFYPSRHTMFRFDFGDTIIRLGGITCPVTNCSRSDISNNFQFGLGVGLRF